MRGFGIWKIDDGIYDILDEGNSSFYIVEGEDQTAVIDTGISPGQKILPLIRKYTSKPLILVLTHAHIDHWYHMDEFETVYMCHREFEVGPDALRDMMADKDLHPERALDIRTDTRIELGGTSLSICEVPGHTPGSVVVLDERSNRLFTGDAIGSVPEGLFTHLIMVPFDLTDEWTVKSVREKGVYNVRDTMAVLENEKGEQRELTMVFSWPVKQPIRCYEERLRPDEIASRLNFIAYQEHIEIEPDAVNLLARLADGGMRDGVSLLDQCASAANGPVTLESVYASLGLAGEKRTAELMQAIAEQDTAKALTIFSVLYSAGKDVGALLGEMCALCRDLLVLRTAPKSGLSMLSGIATEQQALALQTVFSPGELMRVLTETQKTRASFGKNTDVRVAAELLLMQLCEPALRLDAQALNARISRVEEQLASGALVKSAPKTSGSEADFDDDRPPFPDDADDPERGSVEPLSPQKQAQPPAAPQPETPAGFWPALSEKLRAALPAKISGFFAVNGPIHPVLQGEVLIMAADSDFVLDLVKKTPDTEALVREKASAILGKPVSVRFALKNRLSRLGDDPMDALVQFGQQHSDIFTIK